MNSELTAPPAGSAVLVTGASGFTGACLTRRLVEAGCRVRAIARSSSNLSALSDLEIEWRRGDVFDRQVATDAVKGIEYIFHVAAAYREAKIAEETYHRVHVESTQHLARAAYAEEGFKRFVHVSTIGVHGHIDQPPANEEYRFAPGDTYQRTKLEAELWFREFASSKGLPWTVIRPAGIFGPGDRRLFKIFRMAAGKVFPVLGYGKCLYHLVHVEDLARVMMMAAVSPRALGEVFIAGNESPIPLTEFVRIASSEMGTSPLVVRVPASPFFVLGDLCEALCKPLGIEPPIYRRRVAFFTKDRSFDTRKLREVLGYRMLHDNESGIRETARWYVQNGWLANCAIRGATSAGSQQVENHAAQR